MLLAKFLVNSKNSSYLTLTVCRFRNQSKFVRYRSTTSSDHSRDSTRATASNDGQQHQSPMGNTQEETGKAAGSERLHHENSENDVKEQIFEAAMNYVPKYGWSTKSLAAGAESIGLPPTAHGLFPNGAPDLITYFYLKCNADLCEQMAEQKEAEAEGRVEKKKISTFIRDAVEMRLRMNIPYIEQWPQAMGIMVLPHNAPQSWRNLSYLVDDIWYHAGDRKIDMSWYTKRISLGTVYKATEINMLQDNSDDFEQTWEFLDRRLSNVVTVGKTIRQVESVALNMGENLWTATQLARNVLGMNDRHR